MKFALYKTGNKAAKHDIKNYYLDKWPKKKVVANYSKIFISAQTVMCSKQADNTDLEILQKILIHYLAGFFFATDTPYFALGSLIFGATMMD